MGAVLAAVKHADGGVLCRGAERGARLANTGRGLPRPINGGGGAGRLTPRRVGAVNLWTVGCADPRLTAQARSPMDKPGKTPCVSPTLPTGRRLPTRFTAPRNKTR